MDLSQLLESGCGVHVQGMMQKRVCMVLVRTHRFVMLRVVDGGWKWTAFYCSTHYIWIYHGLQQQHAGSKQHIIPVSWK